MSTASLKQKYQAEIERLDEEQRDLARMWTQVPWFALCAVLAPVVGYVWGWGAGVVELLVSGALVGVRAYLIAVRMTENRWTHDKLLDDMAEADGEPAHTSGVRGALGLERSGTRAAAA